MINVTLMTIHGFWSSPATWDRLNAIWQADEQLRGLKIHPFGYPSPKKPHLPFSPTRVPDYDDIAQTLATEYTVALAGANNVAIVTHSQGGLIAQRFLTWMLGEGRGQELARIRSITMLACPNGGSEYLRSIRQVLGYGRHAQATNLEVLNRRVADNERTVLQRIVNAAGVDDHQCRIPLHVYAGNSDRVVTAASAQAGFPGASALAGNHFSILDPGSPGNRTADTVKHHLIADLLGNRARPIRQGPQASDAARLITGPPTDNTELSVTDQVHGASPYEEAVGTVESTQAPVLDRGSAITDRWSQTSDGGKVPSLMSLTHTGMFHPGYGARQTQDVPPSVKLGTLVACNPIDPSSSGSELRAKFLAFLNGESVRQLIGALTYVAPSMSWKNLAGHGPRTLEAALTAGDDPMEGVPVASALLLPPTAGESLYGRNGRSATLVLYVEPRTSDGLVPRAADLSGWHTRFNLALAVPAAFADFLARDLGLGAFDDPYAQLGIWLNSYQPLTTTMVDTQGLRTLPGSSQSNQFIGWAFADRDGNSIADTTRDLLVQLCEYTLHLDAFEQTLVDITGSTASGKAKYDTDTSVSEPSVGGGAGSSGGRYVRDLTRPMSQENKPITGDQTVGFREPADSPPTEADLPGHDEEGVVDDQTGKVVQTSDEVSTGMAAVLAKRFSEEWVTDIASFTKLKEQPSFQEASAALRRGAELNLISKHGIRAELGGASTFLRIPHADDWPAHGTIPFHIETRWLEDVLVQEWEPDQSFVDMLVAMAAKLRSTPYWKGERSYSPDSTFEQISDLLLYGIEMIRKGCHGEINRIFQIVGDDWVITEWELIDKSHHYQIVFRRFADSDWISHVTEKTWADRDNFIEAFGTAQMLIHSQIFDGRLSPGWAPPNIWPFKVTYDGYTLDL